MNYLTVTRWPSLHSHLDQEIELLEGGARIEVWLRRVGLFARCADRRLASSRARQSAHPDVPYRPPSGTLVQPSRIVITRQWKSRARGERPEWIWGNAGSDAFHVKQLAPCLVLSQAGQVFPLPH